MTTSNSTRRPARGATVLWASAFVLAALVIMQAGRLPENRAYGDMSSRNGDLTLLTASSGRGEGADAYELLYVLDDRDEVLLVYDIENAQKKQIILREAALLPRWFANARR